jgi:tRNA pseudouridine55 synthase
MSGERVPAKVDSGERARSDGTTVKRARWESGLVIVDKAGGMTSHDVVARIRRLAGTRRVGHAGTLDPMATGVLVIGVEKATRLLGYLMLTEKEYAATIRLGQSTTTDDAEGEPTGGAPAAAIARTAVDAEIAKLTGQIMQVPPGVSAIKVNGERAYKLTRAGAAPELAARPVTVHSFTVTSVRQVDDHLDLDAVIRCSSGTYIRALARDLGAALGVGGHLTALRRTAVGPYHLDQAHTLEELENRDPAEERTRPTPHPQSATAASPSTPTTPAPAPAAAPVSAAVPVSAGVPVSAAVPVSAGVPVSAAVLVTADTPVSWVTPLADAAAATFPRLDLSTDDARRLAQGARLPLPPHLSGTPSPVTRAPITQALSADQTPIAAFAPDGTLVALVTAESGSLRSLAVFIDAQQTPAPA